MPLHTAQSSPCARIVSIQRRVCSLPRRNRFVRLAVLLDHMLTHLSLGCVIFSDVHIPCTQTLTHTSRSAVQHLAETVMRLLIPRRALFPHAITKSWLFLLFQTGLQPLQGLGICVWRVAMGHLHAAGPCTQTLPHVATSRIQCIRRKTLLR